MVLREGAAPFGFCNHCNNIALLGEGKVSLGNKKMTRGTLYLVAYLVDLVLFAACFGRESETSYNAVVGISWNQGECLD